MLPEFAGIGVAPRRKRLVVLVPALPLGLCPCNETPWWQNAQRKQALGNPFKLTLLSREELWMRRVSASQPLQRAYQFEGTQASELLKDLCLTLPAPWLVGR